MYDDGFGDPVSAQSQVYTADDFDDVNSAQGLSQDSCESMLQQTFTIYELKFVNVRLITHSIL